MLQTKINLNQNVKIRITGRTKGIFVRILLNASLDSCTVDSRFNAIFLGPFDCIISRVDCISKMPQIFLRKLNFIALVKYATNFPSKLDFIALPNVI